MYRTDRSLSNVYNPFCNLYDGEPLSHKTIETEFTRRLILININIKLFV